jgi:hypothetical protein
MAFGSARTRKESPRVSKSPSIDPSSPTCSAVCWRRALVQLLAFVTQITAASPDRMQRRMCVPVPSYNIALHKTQMRLVATLRLIDRRRSECKFSRSDSRK